jgi:type IV secretory pathway component VirB8
MIYKISGNFKTLRINSANQRRKQILQWLIIFFFFIALVVLAGLLIIISWQVKILYSEEI